MSSRKHPLEPGDTDWGKNMERRVKETEREAARARAEKRLNPSSPYNGPEMRQNRERWHLAKDVPLVLIGAVIIQTVGAIWWIAQLSGKIDNVVITIQEFKNERYTREDARRDRELIDQKLQTFSQADREFDRRLNNTEGRVDRLERK